MVLHVLRMGRLQKGLLGIGSCLDTELEAFITHAVMLWSRQAGRCLELGEMGVWESSAWPCQSQRLEALLGGHREGRGLGLSAPGSGDQGGPGKGDRGAAARRGVLESGDAFQGREGLSKGVVRETPGIATRAPARLEPF